LIQIFTEKPSARLQYTAEALFGRIGGHKVEIVSNKKKLNPQYLLINYSDNHIPSDIQIVPQGLLYETGIRKVQTSWSSEGSIPELLLEGKPFDLLAAGFYLLSRYEEYDYYTPDHHQRFPAEESCLLEGQVLERPIVDEWVTDFLNSHAGKISDLRKNSERFKVISTIDVDQAWKYKHKPLWLHFARSLSDVVNGNWAAITERWSVLFNKKRDPWYTYDFLKNFANSIKLNVKCFIQVGRRGEFDKNVAIQNKAFRRLINNIHSFASVGIHPSYSSNFNTSWVGKEKEDLELVLGKQVTLSRQHYLMHKMPETYQHLVKLGIQEEHTLGYSTHLGFRAGTSIPFYFYDIEKETATRMLLVPFCFMDITPQHYLKWTPEESIKRLKTLVDKVHAVQGTFASLWHNESLSNQDQWKNWRKVYEEVHTYACALEAQALT
jgi:hypothetical protein